MSLKLYHGCKAIHVQSIMDDIKISGIGFFMTPSLETAKEYGSQVVCFEVEDFECYISTIDKSGNPTEDLKSGLEYVLQNPKHLTSFYKALEDVYKL